MKIQVFIRAVNSSNARQQSCELQQISEQQILFKSLCQYPKCQTLKEFHTFQNSKVTKPQKNNENLLSELHGLEIQKSALRF